MNKAHKGNNWTNIKTRGQQLLQPLPSSGLAWTRAGLTCLAARLHAQHNCNCPENDQHDWNFRLSTTLVNYANDNLTTCDDVMQRKGHVS